MTESVPNKEINLLNKETPKKTSSIPLIITGLIIGLIVIAIATNGFSFLRKKNQVYNIDIGLAPVLGDPNAPMTIYEFSDFSCPYCAAAAGYNDDAMANLLRNNRDWVAPLPEIKKDYIKTGKVKLVYKYSPGHGTGQAAQLVGWCLNDQNLFWEFYDKAFENQKETSSMQKMREQAIGLNANITLLDDCLQKNKYNYLLLNDSLQGRQIGIEATPSFVIGNEIISGAQSYPKFKEIIDKSLSKLSQ